jgi:hypothetical protein
VRTETRHATRAVRPRSAYALGVSAMFYCPLPVEQGRRITTGPDTT